MLNTKPIKKIPNVLDNQILNLSSDTKNSTKIIKLANSKIEELENIVNQTNINDINKNETKAIEYSQQQINSQIQNQVLNREFTYDRYKDKNLNVSNLIDGNKMFIENNETKQNLYEMKINPINNLTNVNCYGDTFKINWNDIDNCYVITNISTNEIECKIYNESILKYIVSNEITDIAIKKYLFIISWNNQTENFEFNFIDSIFTNNFDMMIKLQNFLYDILINFDNLDISDTYNYQESILMFYFQMTIYLFNNFEKYSINNDLNKISRIYSSIVYRFSSLILKNILKIKNSINTNNVVLNDLMLLRSDIFSQINFMNDKVEQYMITIKNDKSNTETLDITNTSDKFDDSIDSIESNNSNNSNSSNSSNNLNDSNSSKRYSIINKNDLKNSTDINKIEYSSEKNMDYINKNGKKIKKINDLFTDELQINTEEFNSDNNGYVEINDTFADNKNNKHNTNNLSKLIESNNIEKVIPIENSVISHIKSYTAASKEHSYNPNSAIKNSKIFKIPI